MYTLDSLPKNYRPYAKLNLCGNKIIGGIHIISIGGKLPIIIGSGAKPQIWISALTSRERDKSILLVDSSIPKFPWVRVEEQGRQMLVKVHGATILRVEQTGEDQAIVSELDLRSIGFNVHGGLSSLFVANSQFSGGTIEGSTVLVEFAE